MTGSRSELVFASLPADDPVQRCPDISLAKKVLSWRPTTTLEVGLRQTIDYFSSIRPATFAPQFGRKNGRRMSVER
jgi:UDP-glucuronate decarboxylase